MGQRVLNDSIRDVETPVTWKKLVLNSEVPYLELYLHKQSRMAPQAMQMLARAREMSAPSITVTGYYPSAGAYAEIPHNTYVRKYIRQKRYHRILSTGNTY